jgi:hypothetical protein
MKSVKRTARDAPVFRFHDDAGFANSADGTPGVRVKSAPKNLMAIMSHEKTQNRKDAKCVVFALLEKIRPECDRCENFFKKRSKRLDIVLRT